MCGVVSNAEFHNMLDELVPKLQPSKPDTVIGLARGGLFVAGFVAQRLGISGEFVVGLPTYRTDTGDYLIGGLATLRNLTGRKVIIVDDASIRGILLENTRDLVLQHGAKTAQTAVLIADDTKYLPDFIVRTQSPLPKFYWEL